MKRKVFFLILCFILSLFIAPIVKCVPMSAIAPVLILIGVSMMGSVKSIDWDDISIAMPAFFTIIVMPFAYSITAGIEIGFIFYILSNIASKKHKNVSLIIYIFSLLFLVDFVYSALK